MAPTLLNGQYVLAVGVKESNPLMTRVRGQIIAFLDPEQGQDLRVKRVVGLPDEHVAVRERRVEIDGVPIDEPYLDAPMDTYPKGATQWFTGPEDYFLLGDNRGPSRDSRAYGPVSRELIVARVRFRCWPPKKF